MSSTGKSFTSIIPLNPEKPMEAGNAIRPSSPTQKPPLRSMSLRGPRGASSRGCLCQRLARHKTGAAVLANQQKQVSGTASSTPRLSRARRLPAGSIQQCPAPPTPQGGLKVNPGLQGKAAGRPRSGQLRDAPSGPILVRGWKQSSSLGQP